MTNTTLVEMLENNRTVDRAVTYLDGENSERRVSYADLYTRALGILHHLQSLGAQRNDKLIIFLNNNEQFIDGFWAAICGGIVPVPLAVGISDEHRHKLLRVARKLGKAFLYTDAKTLDRLGALAREVGETALFEDIRSRTFLVESLTDISKPGRLHRPAPDDLAFIQFSSGSTSEPKGVMLTHANLIANCEGAAAIDKYARDDVSLSWMPLTHDMGLIGFFIMQFNKHVHIHLMPTDLFVRRPLLWMQLAAKKRATITCSPNFGYRHFLKVLGDRRLDNVDLSSIRSIYNGAEPISVGLCNEFMQALAYTGLKRHAMFPVYGMAEASLAVTFPEPGTDYTWIRVNRRKLGIGTRIELNPADSRDVLELMSVGKAVPSIDVRVTDAARTPLTDGNVGHILISGQSVTHGYFGDPEATTLAIDAQGWLDTGDLGSGTRGQSLHRGPHEGNHLYQWLELLPLRSREHRAARARSRPQQGSGRRHRQAWITRRGTGGVRPASQRHAGISAHGRGRQPAHQRAHRPRGRPRHSRQAHPEDHQRQGATPPA